MTLAPSPTTTKDGKIVKHNLKLTIAAAAALIAVLEGTAVYAQEKYSLKTPDGIAFSDFQGYEDWAVVSSARTEIIPHFRHDGWRALCQPLLNLC